MKKTSKSSIIISAILVIALCVSLMVGGTMALFTSESKVNIAVTSGKVKVTATITDLAVYSPTSISSEDGNAILDDTNSATMITEGVQGKFFNNGTATLNTSEGTITLDKLTPGDKATFKITVTNKSNIKVKYRTIIKKVEPTDDYLYSVLDFNIGGLSPEYYSVWQTLETPSLEEETIKTYNCSVELPTTTDGSDYMDKTCTIAVLVEAVQGNTATTDEQATTIVNKEVVAENATVIMDNDTEETSTIKAVVPAGSTSATSLSLVKTPTLVPGNITIQTGNKTVSTDVKLIDQDGNKVSSLDGSFFTITLLLDANVDIVNFYHNSTLLTKVNSTEELTAKDLYYYDTATGKLTFTTIDFSVFTAEIKFGGGLGTEEYPYLISTADDWARINSEEQSESKYYKQTADIVTSDYIGKFAGTYDGGGYELTCNWYATNTNFGFLFEKLCGHATFKNINVTMDEYAVVLLHSADLGKTAYGATFDTITFNGENTVKPTANNFGFVMINPVYTGGTGEAVYNFTNIINNVSVENTGNSTGVFVGSGPYFTVKSTLNYTNCINNGNITGTKYVGYLYGNGTASYAATVAKTGSEINITNCINNGIMHAVNTDGLAQFALNLTDLNTQYQELVGGDYISGPGALKDANITVSQNGTLFSLKGTPEGYSYKLAFAVSDTFHTIDAEAWTEDDVEKLSVTSPKYGGVWHISNSTKYFCEVTIDENATDGHTTIKALDKRTAQAQGFDVENMEFDNNYALVVKDGVTYLIIDIGDKYYINSSVSLYVYAYDENNALVGLKAVA